MASRADKTIKLSEEEIKKDREIVLNFINEKSTAKAVPVKAPEPAVVPAKNVAPKAALPMEDKKVIKKSMTATINPMPKTAEVIPKIAAIKKPKAKISLKTKEKIIATKAVVKNDVKAKTVSSLDKEKLEKIESTKKKAELIKLTNEKRQEKNLIELKKIEHSLKHRNYKALLKFIFLVSLLFLVTLFSAYAIFWLVVNAVNLS